jgi:HEAT repeat protein
MHVLGKIGDARALEPLLEALGNKNPSERGNAADALGESGNACAVEPLCRALGDMSMYEIIDGSGLVQSGVVQSAAARALARIGDASAVEPLCACLKTSPDVAVAEALLKIGAPPQVEAQCKDFLDRVYEEAQQASKVVCWPD